MESSPIATPSFRARVKEDVSVRFPIEVLNEPLFEDGVTLSIASKEFPFGVDDDAFALWSCGDEVGEERSSLSVMILSD